MVISRLYYLWVAICSLLVSCSEIKNLTLPEGLDNNFRSGDIRHPLLKAGAVQVLEYRVISDSVIQSANKDTAITFGIIFPRSSLVIKIDENKMVFGTDSLQCIIRYETKSLHRESEQNSILTDIVLNPEKNDPDYSRYKKSITPYKKIVAGSIQLPLLKEEVQFQFEHEKAEKNFDSAAIKGYIQSGTDSFFIKPLYKKVWLRGKNVKPMQVLQGYCLTKGDKLYAFLQHAPMVKTVYEPELKDVLFLNTKTSEAEQMLIAAYFCLVSRLVLTPPNEPLY